MASTRTTAIQRAASAGLLSELTTVFGPPCQITWLLTTTKVPSQYPAFPSSGPSSCDPPEWQSLLAQKGFAYYSPAICPIGFSAGCTVNGERTGEGFPAITADETAMYCIPSGFTCTSDTTDFRGGVWGFLRTASGNGASVTVGPAMQIRWREEDLTNLATDPLTPGVTAVKPTTSQGSSPTLIAVPSIPDIPPIPSISTFLNTAATSSSSSTELTISIPIVSSPGVRSTGSTTTEASATISIASPASQSDTATSTQPIGTTTTDHGDAPSPSATEENTPSISSSTNTAAMALSGILIVMFLGFLVVATIRRYRRYRAGEVKTLFPFRVRIWVNRMLGKRSDALPAHRTTTKPSPKGAELGTDGPTPELGPGYPLGTKENPAELVGSGVRNSWMSQVSRMFTVKLKKEVWSV